MKIYFVTHATSKDNEKGIASGWRDVELSEIGIQQAKNLGERLKNIKIDLICCSDLKRAINTVKIAFGEKYPIIVDRRLREINYGDFNGKLKELINSIKEKYIKEPFPNGESYEQAVARVQEFFKELKEKYSDKTVLVVGHRTTQYGLEVMVGQKTLKECLKTPFRWQPYWEYSL
jgi:broad specificity phosphatase PhoE